MTPQQRAYRQMKEKRTDDDYAELESVQKQINDLVVSINAASDVVYCREAGDQLVRVERTPFRLTHGQTREKRGACHSKNVRVFATKK